MKKMLLSTFVLLNSLWQLGEFNGTYVTVTLPSEVGAPPPSLVITGDQVALEVASKLILFALANSTTTLFS